MTREAKQAPWVVLYLSDDQIWRVTFEPSVVGEARASRDMLEKRSGAKNFNVLSYLQESIKAGETIAATPNEYLKFASVPGDGTDWGSQLSPRVRHTLSSPPSP